jgi:DNA repair protein RadA/Sms
MVEEIVSKSSADNLSTSRLQSFLASATNNKPQPLSKIDSSVESRIILGNNTSELDRVLGGGMVKGSLVLIGGEPGIGKSTLSLQIPLGNKSIKTLYVSGEESAKQIRLRADRLGGAHDNCIVLAETSLENILTQSKEIAPELLIIDSIQTIYSGSIESSAGSVSQVRECAASLLRYAKESNTPVILIGHITKDGTLAGPKVLEHMVDAVLNFEGDKRQSYRIIRASKNRFGSTNEIGVFDDYII